MCSLYHSFPRTSRSDESHKMDYHLVKEFDLEQITVAVALV